MKKTITLLLLGFFLSSGLFAQVQVIVTAPSSIAGPLTVAVPAWGGSVETPIVGEAAVVNDGSATPQQGCVASPADAYAGKIVFVRRGTCEFSLKALNAQNAGAIAVIIVNNAAASPPPGMAAGTFGLEITIPVFATTLEDGDRVIAALENSEVVEINIRRSNFVIGRVHYPVDYASIPKAANNEVVTEMGMTVTNNSRAELTNLVFKYQFVDAAGTVYASDSTTLASMAIDEVVTIEWVLDEPISLADLPVGDYSFQYIVYNENDPFEEPGDNVASRLFRVTTDLWSHEHGATTALRPGAGGDHIHATSYAIPAILADNVVRFKATTMSFIAANNTTEIAMAGQSVFVYLARLVDPASFDRAKDIFDESQFEIVGYNNHIFQDESQRFVLVTLPWLDINTDEEGVDLVNGNEYWAVTSYSGDASLLFNGYSEQITYPLDHPNVTSFVYTGGNWVSFGDSIGGFDSGVGRLGIEYVFTIGTELTELPEEAVKVFPNPATSNIFVQFDFAKSTDASVIITDINGKVALLREFKGLQSDQVEINTSSLPSGMYIVNTTTKESYKSIKLMIHK